MSVPGDADFEEFPVTGWTAPSNNHPCGDYATLSDDDPDFYAAWDLAVLYLGPSAQQNRLPPITPVKVFLGDNGVAWSNGRLKPFKADPSTGLQTGDTPYYQAAGFGRNVATLEEGSGCLGCNIRRWAGMTNVSFAADSCGIIPSIDCYDTPRWRAASISAGNTAEFSRGDSGGPLVMLDSVTGEQVIVGTASGYYHDPLYSDDHMLRWSQTGVNNDFIWEKLGLPYTDTLTDIRQHAAVYVNGGGVNIDDRAKVIKVQNGIQYGADIIQSTTDSTSYYNRIGVEAVTGNIRAKDTISLADRCQVGDVTTTSSVTRGNNVTAGNIVQATYVHPEGISLSPPPFTPGGPNQEITNNTVVNLSPGVYGDVTVRQNGILGFSRGLYQLNSLTVNAGGIVRRDGSADTAKTWIFIYGTDTPDIEGPLYANPGTVLVGIPNSAYVFISNQFDATIVAPKASVNADLSSAHASLVGSIFAESLTFHQGSVLGYSPFTSNWTPVCTSGNTNCN